MAKGFVGRASPVITQGPGLLQRWSYSQWSSYEKCPAMVKFKQIDKLPEVGDRAALDRGIAVHKVLEDIVKGDLDISFLRAPTPGKPTKLPTWEAEVQTLLDEGATAEDSFAMTQEWKPTSWTSSDAWVRGKLDARARPRIIDYKTGNPYPEHVYQAELYAAVEIAAGTVPEGVTEVPVEFWYLDKPAYHPDAKKTWMFKVADQPQRVAAWNHRVSAMMNDTIFPKRPGMHCRWCGYAASRGGICEAG